MAESSSLTRVDVAIELSIPGKAAQFGRGVMQDVAGGLVTRFAGNLEQIVAARSEAQQLMRLLLHRSRLVTA